MSANAKECREYAQKCRRIAAQAQDPFEKEILENLARTWLRFACEMESSAPLKDWGAPKNAS
jgi:hypothetical protein